MSNATEKLQTQMQEFRQNYAGIQAANAAFNEYTLTAKKGGLAKVNVTVTGSEGEVLGIFTTPVKVMSEVTRVGLQAYEAGEKLLGVLEQIAAEADAIAEGRPFSRIDVHGRPFADEETHGDIVA